MGIWMGPLEQIGRIGDEGVLPTPLGGLFNEGSSQTHRFASWSSHGVDLKML